MQLLHYNWEISAPVFERKQRKRSSVFAALKALQNLLSPPFRQIHKDGTCLQLMKEYIGEGSDPLTLLISVICGDVCPWTAISHIRLATALSLPSEL